MTVFHVKILLIPIMAGVY